MAMFGGQGYPFLQQYIEENPEALYRAYLPEDPALRRYYQPRFYDTYQQFQADLARQAEQGQMPRGSFGDYLRGYEWEQQYRRLMPRERGNYPSQIAPRSRFLNW